MLQKLRLMLNLENIALQRNLALIEQQLQHQQSEATEDASGTLSPVSSTAASAILSAGGKVQAGMLQAVRAAARSSTALGGGASVTGPGGTPPPLRAMGPAGQAALVGLHGVGSVTAMQLPPLLSASGSLAEEKALWTKRLDQVQTLLSTVTQLHSQLTTICDKPEVSWPLVNRYFDDTALLFCLLWDAV